MKITVFGHMTPCIVLARHQLLGDIMFLEEVGSHGSYYTASHFRTQPSQLSPYKHHLS